MASIDNSPQPEAFKVYVRIRPFLTKELPTNQRRNSSSSIIGNISTIEPKSIFIKEDNILFLTDPSSTGGKKERTYIFDDIFDDTSNNFEVFEKSIKPIIDNILLGYNSTALAYGVTGTGKTHTVFGDLEKENYEPGIIINAGTYLFDQINSNENKVSFVKVSYWEIYNETIIDWLNPRSKQWLIIEDNLKGVIVPEWIEYEINNSNDLLKIIRVGNARRTMAATNQNQFSSRSHAVLQIIVEQRNKVRDIKEEVIISKLLIVDLAGSERGGLEKGLRRDEGANINKSLLSWGNCINWLSDKTKLGAFVPYRDSKLTRWLKDSLGGNILTVMLACVSPSRMLFDESVNTWNYATRARKIQKKVIKNVKEISVHISQYKEIIDSLKEEITQWKDVIKEQDEKLKERGNISLIIPIEDEKGIGISENNNYNGNFEDTLLISTIERTSHPKPNNNLNKNQNIFPSNINGNYGNIFFSTNSNMYTNGSVWKNNISNRNNINKTVQTLNIDMYKEYLENGKMFDLTNNNNINEIEKQVENIKNDKNLLETYIEGQSVQDDAITAKLSTLRDYYDKYIELINDKWIENIEQSMILKFNLKEINEWNVSNTSNLDWLQKQILIRVENEEEFGKLNEEIGNIENAIRENEGWKEKIKDSFIKNWSLKKCLKKILLNLLTSTKNSGKKYVNVLKEKKEWVETTKKYEKKLEIVEVLQKEKTYELEQKSREVELLKLKLYEKDREIYELKKKTTTPISKLEAVINSGKDYDNVIKQKFQRKVSTPQFKRGNTNKNMKVNWNSVNNSMLNNNNCVKNPMNSNANNIPKTNKRKRTRSRSTIIQTPVNQEEKGNEIVRPGQDQAKGIGKINKNYSYLNTNVKKNNIITQKNTRNSNLRKRGKISNEQQSALVLPYYSKQIGNNKTLRHPNKYTTSTDNSVLFNGENQHHFNLDEIKLDSDNRDNQEYTENNNLMTSNFPNKSNNMFNLSISNISNRNDDFAHAASTETPNPTTRMKLTKNYDRFLNNNNIINTINSISTEPRQISSLQQARYENKIKNERSATAIKANKAIEFFNEYTKAKVNETSNTGRKDNNVNINIMSINELNSYKDVKSESNEDQVNLGTQLGNEDENDKKNNVTSVIINEISETSESNTIVDPEFETSQTWNSLKDTLKIKESHEDFFKSITESIKDPRLTKFLDN